MLRSVGWEKQAGALALAVPVFAIERSQIAPPRQSTDPVTRNLSLRGLSPLEKGVRPGGFVHLVTTLSPAPRQEDCRTSKSPMNSREQSATRTARIIETPLATSPACCSCAGEEGSAW
jgi:hypothetical protein